MGLGLGRGLGLGFGEMPGMGMGPGIGMGPRPISPDDRGLRSEKTRGKLAGQGEINEFENFKGLPGEEGEAKIELNAILQSAAQEAEEALGHEEIPRRRAEAVKKYFEGVKK